MTRFTVSESSLHASSLLERHGWGLRRGLRRGLRWRLRGGLLLCIESKSGLLLHELGLEGLHASLDLQLDILGELLLSVKKKGLEKQRFKEGRLTS